MIVVCPRCGTNRPDDDLPVRILVCPGMCGYIGGPLVHIDDNSKIRKPKKHKLLTLEPRVLDAVHAFIRDHPGASMRQIIEQLGFDPNHVFGAIIELEEKAMVVSHTDSIDYFTSLKTTYYPA